VIAPFGDNPWQKPNKEGRKKNEPLNRTYRNGHCGHAVTFSLELREKVDKFFGSEETFLAGLPQSLECLLHEFEVGRNYRVNVHKEAQLFCIALPVPIQGRILILFGIVEAVNKESDEGGEVREFRRIALPGIELSLGLIESSKLDRSVSPESLAVRTLLDGNRPAQASQTSALVHPPLDARLELHRRRQIGPSPISILAPKALRRL
jgi:hypothetical protein